MAFIIQGSQLIEGQLLFEEIQYLNLSSPDMGIFHHQLE